MLQVREKEISLRNSSGGSEYLRTQRERCWRCNANGRSQIALSFLHYKGNAHVTGTITKNASFAAIAKYISIMTIYTVGYLRIFNAGHLENTNYDYILLSKQGRTQLIYSTELTTEHVFKNFGGGLPGCSPPNCSISQQDLSASLRNKSCKRLGSRPKRSMKPCYTNRTICVLTRLRPNLL